MNQNQLYYYISWLFFFWNLNLKIRLCFIVNWFSKKKIKDTNRQTKVKDFNVVSVVQMFVLIHVSVKNFLLRHCFQILKLIIIGF